MYKIYLNDEDLREETPYLVLALLNEAANEDFVEFMQNLIDGIGSGYNYTTCYFWEELDDFDRENTPQFEGLRIESENGDVITVSFDELIYYMKMLCERIQTKDRDVISNLINEFSEKYDL